MPWSTRKPSVRASQNRYGHLLVHLDGYVCISLHPGCAVQCMLKYEELRELRGQLGEADTALAARDAQIAGLLELQVRVVIRVFDFQ